MGRYWRTERFEGKFGFAIQESDDPLLFGMEYDDEYDDDDDDERHFIATENTLHTAHKALTEAYEALGVPASRRIYYVTSDDMLWNIYDKMWGYAYEPCGADEATTTDENGNPAKERKRGCALALCRVALGMAIYSEAVDRNVWLDAEC